MDSLLMVVLVLICLDLGLLNTDGLKEESIDGIVDIDAADETEPRALNWFDVSSSYGWYVKLPAFCVSHLQQIHDMLSFCRLFNSDAFKSRQSEWYQMLHSSQQIARLCSCVTGISQ
jgi:hypothetical protein